MKLPVHTTLEEFETRDGCLVIGGKPVAQIAEELGTTPFYAYSRELVDRRIEKLRQALPDSIDIHYAMKANPMPALVDHIAKQVDGLDVASGGELSVALKTDMAVEHVSFAGPGKQDEELAAAVKAGIVINAESAAEVSRLIDIGKQLDRNGHQHHAKYFSNHTNPRSSQDPFDSFG